MSDGAHKGVKPERAMETIIGGGPQPAEDEKQTPGQILAEIRGAPMDAHTSYDGCALACARIILEAYEKYPALRLHPTEHVYLKHEDGKTVILEDSAAGLIPLTYDLGDILKRLHPDENRPERQVLSELTGFMWGWAVNAVGYALGEPPKPNPAILTIRVPGE